VNAIARACERRLASETELTRELEWALRIAALHPNDPGIAVALALNLVVLEPGQALFLPAGYLHAYLEGTGVEIMASSDNVLRGGLTPKHVDVPELLDVLDFHAAPASLVKTTTQDHEISYMTPARRSRSPTRPRSAPPPLRPRTLRPCNRRRRDSLRHRHGLPRARERHRLGHGPCRDPPLSPIP
jgi:mannose-6-phosphate isomerase